MDKSSSSRSSDAFEAVLENTVLAQEPISSARMRFQLTLKNKFASGGLAGGAEKAAERAHSPERQARHSAGASPSRVERRARLTKRRAASTSAEPAARPLWKSRFLIPVLATAAAAFFLLGGPQFFTSGAVSDGDAAEVATGDGIDTEGTGGEVATGDVAIGEVAIAEAAVRTWTARVGSMLEAVRIDGQPLETAGGDLASFAVALAGADTVSFGSSEVEVELEEEGIYLAILPNTVLERMPFQEQKRSDPLTLYLASGEVFVTTKKGSGPHDIRIFTPDYEVRVTGTTLGVMCAGSTTCVCVAEGAVRVREQSAGDDSEWVVVDQDNSLLFRGANGKVEQHWIPHESDFSAAPDPAHFAEHVVELRDFLSNGTRKQ